MVYYSLKTFLSYFILCHFFNKYLDGTISLGNISTTKASKCIILYLILLVDKLAKPEYKPFSPTDCNEASKRRKRWCSSNWNKEAIMTMAKTHQIVLAGSSWGIRNTFHSLAAILTTLLVVTTIYLRQDKGQVSPKILNAPPSNSSSSSSKCDLFYGKWVFDNESYPLYKEKQCTFMSDQLACEKFGRKDLTYQNWRWRPHQCDLPRCVLLLTLFRM